MNQKCPPQKNRMIHIRLDQDTHRRLKTRAAQDGLTIQQTVEDLIHRILRPSATKKTRL